MTVPIIAKPDPPRAAPLVQGLNINGLAVALLLVLASIVSDVWAVDEHFISRREFNSNMRIVAENLRAINYRLGIVAQTPAPSSGREDAHP